MIHDNEISNRSGNRPFEDVLRVHLSRRNLLTRSAALSATGFLAAMVGDKILSGGATAATAKGSAAGSQALENAIARKEEDEEDELLINFPPVPFREGGGKTPTISSDYDYRVLIPWGTALQPGGPEYDGNPATRPTAAQQAEQIGIGHDGMWFFPLRGSDAHGVLCINHEFGTNPHVLGKPQPTSIEDVKLSQHAHGVSVVEIRNDSEDDFVPEWKVVRSRRSRRIHGNTPVTFSGPAAEHPLLQTPAKNSTLGTLNNCANGYTPWGTYLTCEENFNGYFGAKGTWTATEA
ncbi:MAG: DUF839 domain-containing protein, partial [Leptolyngbyaceae cyanobacterium bins.59]|nr:DUF839 domain-containing protein [Leptolyngbyaceae cyanobacterium bins.59]